MYMESKKQNKEVVLPMRVGFILVDAKDIIRCKGDGMYTTFFLSDKRTIVVCKNLKEWEKKLDQSDFIRVHTTHLVNRIYIKEYLGGKVSKLVMTDNSCVPVARRRKHFLKNKTKCF